jgi:hypothetical protein
VRRLALLSLIAAFLLVPAAARAAIVPGATVDGPTADIPANNIVQSDAAPDGTAAIAYLKGATPHVWVSRLVSGAWTAPEQADTALATASSAPRIGVANGGKVVVTFVNGGQLWGVVKPNGTSPFGVAAPISIVTASYGDVDLAPGGNGYVAIGRNNDVFATRVEGSTFTPVPGPGALGELNSNAADDAGTGDGQARLATSADGSGAVMVWAEGPAGNETIFVRQLTGTTAGAALDARLTALNGAPAAAAPLTMPDVDVDGAGTGWVVFRQFFTYGAQNFAHAIARPLPAGGTLGTAQVVDGLATPPTENVEYPRVDVNALGQGLTANYLGTTFGVQSASLAGSIWTAGSLVNPVANGATAFASPAMAENGSGLVSWNHDPDGPGAEVSRVVARTTRGGFGPVLTLSDPTLGDLQQAQLTSAAGDAFAIVGYVQGGPGAGDPRRVGAAVVDLPGAGGGNPPPKDTTKPKLSKLRLSAKRFRIGGKLASASAVKTGTNVRYTLSEAATVTLSFARVTAGRKVGKRCVKPKRSNRRRKHCTRFVSVKPPLRFSAQAAGQRSIHFEGRLSRRKTLKPGVYRLTLKARDTAGNVSKGLTARITVLPRKR